MSLKDFVVEEDASPNLKKTWDLLLLSVNPNVAKVEDAVDPRRQG